MTRPISGLTAAAAAAQLAAAAAAVDSMYGASSTHKPLNLLPCRPTDPQPPDRLRIFNRDINLAKSVVGG